MLSCYCDADYDYYADPAEDFAPLRISKARCSSCDKKIVEGDIALKFDCWRIEGDEKKENFGDEITMDDEYLCEPCGEIYLNLKATGLCVVLEDMRKTLAEYWDMTGFNPEKYK